MLTTYIFLLPKAPPAYRLECAEVQHQASDDDMRVLFDGNLRASLVEGWVLLELAQGEVAAAVLQSRKKISAHLHESYLRENQATTKSVRRTPGVDSQQVCMKR